MVVAILTPEALIFSDKTPYSGNNSLISFLSPGFSNTGSTNLFFFFFFSSFFLVVFFLSSSSSSSSSAADAAAAAAAAAY
jgi:hypothetical protein